MFKQEQGKLGTILDDIWACMGVLAELCGSDINGKTKEGNCGRP